MNLLYFDEWRETRATMRFISQILGKCCIVSREPEMFHSHAMLDVNSIGFSTKNLEKDGHHFKIDFEIVHQYINVQIDGKNEKMKVETGVSIKQYYDFIFKTLKDHGLELEINTKPYNIPYEKTLDLDDKVRNYNPEIAKKAHELMQQAQYDQYQFLHSKEIKDVKSGLFWDKFDVVSIFHLEGNEQYTISLSYFFGDKYRESPYHIIRIHPFMKDKVNLKIVEPTYAEYNAKNGSFLIYEDDLQNIMRRDEVLLNFFNTAYTSLLSGVSSRLKW